MAMYNELKSRNAVTAVTMTWWCEPVALTWPSKVCLLVQYWNFLLTGSFSPALTNNRFSLYHSLQRQNMLVGPI